MTVARTNHIDNIVLGNGEIYIDVLDDDGNLQGERYLGDSIGATISIATERTTIQSGDGAVARDVADVVRSVSRTMGFTLHDSSIANWALFLIGEEAVGQAARSADGSEVTDEPIGALKKGRSFQLGRTDSNPMGVGKVKSVSAKEGNSAIASANVETSASSVDGSSMLLVDEENGRVTALADLANLKVTYTPAAGTKARMQAKGTATASQILCALRYLEDDPAAGKGRHAYIRKCNLVPGGESALKGRDTEQQMAFTATVQDPGGSTPAIVIDGEEV